MTVRQAWPRPSSRSCIGTGSTTSSATPARAAHVSARSRSSSSSTRHPQHGPSTSCVSSKRPTWCRAVRVHVVANECRIAGRGLRGRVPYELFACCVVRRRVPGHDVLHHGQGRRSGRRVAAGRRRVPRAVPGTGVDDRQRLVREALLAVSGRGRLDERVQVRLDIRWPLHRRIKRTNLVRIFDDLLRSGSAPRHENNSRQTNRICQLTFQRTLPFQVSVALLPCDFAER